MTDDAVAVTQAEVGRARISGARVILDCLYALLAIGTLILFGMRKANLLDDEIVKLARLVDLLVCALFASQAMYSLYKAKNRLRWWKWGWIDVLASVPEIELLRTLRILRLFLLIRVMKYTIKSVQGLQELFDSDQAEAVVASVFALIVVSLITSSFLILGMESNHPDANIGTAKQALLWSIGTLIGAEPTGFGDHYPVTLGGRLINIWLVVVSLGIIGTLAGLISAWIEKEQEPD